MNLEKQAEEIEGILLAEYLKPRRIIKKNLEKNSKKGIKDNIIRNNRYNIIDDKNIKHWKLTKLI